VSRVQCIARGPGQRVHSGVRILEAEAPAGNGDLDEWITDSNASSLCAVLGNRELRVGWEAAGGECKFRTWPYHLCGKALQLDGTKECGAVS
jgi:hypothetical protein